MFDWTIRNALLVDGLNGERRADVCIRGDRIGAILPPGACAESARELDAAGLVLTPGFIDIHRHADLAPLSEHPWDELAQGLTAMVSGNCGFSTVPNSPDTFQAMREYAAPVLGSVPDRLRGMSARAFYELIAEQSLRINCGYLVGNGDLRRNVAGFSDAPLTRDQLRAICALLDEALHAGALGLSMGIMYTPECYHSTDELAAIARVAAGHRKPVVVHMRGEGRSVLQSLEETLAICRLSGAHVHISHMKAAGVELWGRTADEMLARVHEARSEGLDISFDAYPYTAGSTTLLSLLPPESLSGGTGGVLRRIADPIERAALLRELDRNRDGWDNFAKLVGWDRIAVAGSSNPEEVGRTISALALEARSTPGAFALDLLLRENGNVPIILESMSADDVRKIISDPICIVVSDALYSVSGMPHPRKHGAFQRFLCQYVKEEKRLTLPQAIDRITRMPAEFLGIRERGRLEEGFFADLVLMDWEALQDRATYADPLRQSEGIRYVFVNGKLAFANGKNTDEAAGVLLNYAV